MPKMMCQERNGLTSNNSMVPVSFSFAMVNEVIMALTSSKINPITPGTNMYTAFSSGLNNMRGVATITGGEAVVADRSLMWVMMMALA